ncbi:hypothetical protein OC834_002314 [Tilletia horrida]|nr:hypothetical protein OC834_002314 [Tilletia horrida]
MRPATLSAPFATLCAIVLSTFLLAVSPATAAEVDDADTSNILVERTAASQEALKAHNAARAKYGVPPLVWDEKLASYAYLKASFCKFQHTGGPYGENLAAGTYLSYASAVQMWMDEAKFYKKGDSFSYQTGHFTAVVWKSTRKVGCALVACTPRQLGFGRRDLMAGRNVTLSIEPTSTDQADEDDDEDEHEDEDEDEDEDGVNERSLEGDLHKRAPHKKHRKHHRQSDSKVKRAPLILPKPKPKPTTTTTTKTTAKTTAKPKPTSTSLLPIGGIGGGGLSGTVGGNGKAGYVMCEYWPAGNVLGQFLQNVPV